MRSTRKFRSTRWTFSRRTCACRRWPARLPEKSPAPPPLRINFSGPARNERLPFTGLLHGQNHLPDIFPVVDVLVRESGLRERKRLTDHRLDLASCIHAGKLVHFALQKPRALRNFRQAYAD